MLSLWAVHVYHAGHRFQNRSERKSTEPQSSCPVSPGRCPAPSLAVEGCWSAHGHPLQRGPAQRSAFICRSTPGEEMKLWIWSNRLLSFHPSPCFPSSHANTRPMWQRGLVQRCGLPFQGCHRNFCQSLDCFGKADSTGPPSRCHLWTHSCFPQRFCRPVGVILPVKGLSLACPHAHLAACPQVLEPFKGTVCF